MPKQICFGCKKSKLRKKFTGEKQFNSKKIGVII